MTNSTFTSMGTLPDERRIWTGFYSISKRGALYFMLSTVHRPIFLQKGTLAMLTSINYHPHIQDMFSINELSSSTPFLTEITSLLLITSFQSEMLSYTGSFAQYIMLPGTEQPLFIF